ncbi:semaphorin-4E-like [Carassius carassius]|uniref:semaphorin-4E-like n=1 Tax=Carassius carassius TaxID=217509 RepID=UPI0028689E8B|nr:semaphorin-4E-like [Carassius carassius]XP_059357195.1 semaphorin-4E-like [Carassius carassius]XP_059357196.1 semaphorin-4E-like [Carassius carassius]XP_059357197.1 semaphorin-4E-like [Carassius carassius]XP_059357198.1 semaphorin-4E-like [Carassius carassius]
MMFLLAVLCVFYIWSPTTLSGGLGATPNTIPRKTVPINRNGGRLFREEGVWNYTTMLLREDLNMLILGAREAIYALDLDDITVKKTMVNWSVSDTEQRECSNKGKDATNDCKNYIRILHKRNDDRMYVCGTKAFSPTCDYMSYADGSLTLEGKQEDGKGKCPFDPFQRHTSEMVDGVLYSATSINFRGSEPVMMRSSEEPVRTEFSSSWLNEPNFIHMAHIREGESNPEGDDDKLYLFFSETAVEYDSYTKMDVSRVARVCKGDVGGQRTLQKKWTSFLKARLDCPVPNNNLPLLVQDVFHFCPSNWTTCVFYAVFTPQLDSSPYSAVCAYKIEDIKSEFSNGKFKTSVPVETSFMKWVMYSGDVPDPRPGACIDNHARDMGFTKSLDLPDKTLQFIKDRPLMDQAVKALGEKPLLVKTGAAFTRIVVASATALNGTSHQVMFIGTKSGSVLKAVNYGGEMVIMEEIQLFEPSEPVKILRLSDTKLYVGSNVGVAQLSINECGRYHTCLDCVLARDPYCGWDLEAEQCSTIISTHRTSTVIQSLSSGESNQCPQIGDSKSISVSFFHGSTVQLWCEPYSNLAQVEWQLNGQPLNPSDTIKILSDSLMIINASADANGRYTCSSVEWNYKTQHVEYDLTIWSESGSTALLHNVKEKENTLVAMVVLLSLTLALLVIWNLYKGHFPLPFCHRRVKVTENRCDTSLYENQPPEQKIASSAVNLNRNNNNKNDQRYSSCQIPLRYIDYESEI